MGPQSKKLISVIHYRKLDPTTTHTLLIPFRQLCMSWGHPGYWGYWGRGWGCWGLWWWWWKRYEFALETAECGEKAAVMSCPGCGVFFNQNCNYFIYKQKQKYMVRTSSCALWRSCDFLSILFTKEIWNCQDDFPKRNLDQIFWELCR